MKIRFQRDKLIPTIRQLNRIASAYKTSKEYGNAKISGKDGVLTFEIGNNQSFLHLEVEGDIIKEGVVCVNALDFTGVVARLSGKIIEIESLDGVVIITDGTSKIKIGAINPDLFIATIGFSNKEPLGVLSTNGKDLNRAANICLPFEDEPRFIPGISLKMQHDGFLRLCCCSNASAGIFFIKPLDAQIQQEFETVLPTQGFQDICDIIDKQDITIEFFALLVKIELSNGFITLRTLNKVFPKIEKIIPSSFECELPVDVTKFNNALALIDIIAHDGVCSVEYHSKECTIGNKAGFYTKIQTDVDLNIMLKLNRELFRRAFRLIAKPHLTLLYNGYKKPLIIKEDSTLLILSVLE